LKHFIASLEKLFLLNNHVENKNKLAKTKPYGKCKTSIVKKPAKRLLLAYLSLKSERSQQWSMLSALLVNSKCFE